jgi:CRISPR-associated protein Cmr2
VLTEPKDRPAKLVRKWRLGEAEQLDAIGLIKRTGGDDLADRPKEDKHDLQFVPIFNVALAPWMQLARTTDAGAFKSALDAAAEAGVSMVKRDIACGRPLCDRDASIFLQSRWWPEFKEQSLLQECARKPDGSVDQQEWRQKIQVWGREHIGPLFELMAEPHPYVACLVADGDGMGAAIDALGTAEEHRAFSAELAKFARAAREIVECEAHVGSLVYSGGDDVLAFLPVATALACADELRKRFADIVGPALSKPGGRLKDGVKRLPTLSVGIGIGHVMESMATLLELGRRAEKVAKGGHLKREGKDRNALAIVLDKRSGGTCEWRSQWSDWVAEGGPAGRLLADGSLLDPRGRDSKAPVLPIRKVHQIAALLRRLPEPGGPDPASLSPFNAVLLPELRRTLSRVDGGAGELTVSQVALSAGETETYAENYRRTKAWIDRMLIARVFAESEPRTRAGGAAAEAAA